MNQRYQIRSLGCFVEEHTLQSVEFCMILNLNSAALISFGIPLIPFNRKLLQVVYFKQYRSYFAVTGPVTIARQ